MRSLHETADNMLHDVVSVETQYVKSLNLSVDTWWRLSPLPDAQQLGAKHSGQHYRSSLCMQHLPSYSSRPKEFLVLEEYFSNQSSGSRKHCRLRCPKTNSCLLLQRKGRLT